MTIFIITTKVTYYHITSHSDDFTTDIYYIKSNISHHYIIIEIYIYHY